MEATLGGRFLGLDLRASLNECNIDAKNDDGSRENSNREIKAKGALALLLLVVEHHEVMSEARVHADLIPHVHGTMAEGAISLSLLDE